MNDVTTGAAPAAADSAAIAPAQTAEPVSVMDALTQTMSATYDKINPPRGDGGQFAAKTPDAAAETPAEGAEASDTAKTDNVQSPTEAKTEPPAVAAIDPPLSWTAEMKAKWASLPPDVQAYAAQRENDAHKRISELGRTVQAVTPVKQVLDHYQSDFASRNLDPARGVAMLLEAQRALDTDFETGIRQLAQAYGRPDPYASSHQPGEPGEQTDVIRSLKSEIQALKREVGDTRTKITARELSEQQQFQTSLETLVNDFYKDKTDIAEIEGDLVAHISAIRQTEPGLSHDKILEKAYDAARWANPNTRAKLLADQEKKRTEQAETEQKKKVAEAKKSASINVKGTAASPARKGSWEQTLREVGERIA